MSRLDEMVSERVMGWRRCGDAWVVSEMSEGLTGPLNLHMQYFRAFTDKWSPTTDWNAMRAVVERMRGLGWNASFYSFGQPASTSTDTHRYSAVSRTIVSFQSLDNFKSDEHESTSIACCVAALRALGVPEPEIEEARNAG